MRRVFSQLLVLFVLIAWGAYGQTFRGAINGTVSDPSGAAVSSATVVATDIATNIAHNTVATTSGEFSFQDLPLGTYTVAVTASGFQKTTVTNVVVSAGSVFTVPVQLTVGQQATAVEVSAVAVSIDTTTSIESDTIPSSALQDIPLNGRDFTQLIAVKPGYGGYAVGGFGSLNGTRPNQMNWQIDGTDNNDMWHNIPAVNQGGVSGIAGVVMPIDAIDEFSAQTQSNAETGRNSGGTVNLTIKTGSNEVHGSAYYYNRNEFYAATSPFFVPTPDFPKAPELRNQNWGGTVGGPIVKNRVFFFMGFEKQNYIFGLTGLSTEPSTAWVSQALTLLNTAGVAESPLSARLLSTLYPSSILNLPATTSNYFATVPGTGYSYNGVAKVDINFTDKERLSLHWFGGQGDQTQPPGASLALATASSNLGYYFEVAPIHVQNYSAVLSSVFSNKLTNQLLFGVSYFNQIFHDSNNSFNMAALGLNLSPGALVSGAPVMGASNIVISGFDQVGITPPEGRTDATGHLTDTLSYIQGRHEMKFGGEVRQGHVDEFYYRRSTGQFNFDGTQGPWAGTCGSAPTTTCADTLALADFLAGDVSTSSIAVGDAERKVVVNAFDFFAQDNWQVTPKLNINYGLRWEYFGPLHSSNGNNLGVFEEGQGLEIQGDGLNSIFKPDYHNFSPRFGFAYNAGAGLVLRGGYGIYFDQINMNPFLDFRPPIAAADGLEDNPIGPDAVDSYSRNNYNWQSAQAGGAPIFPGVTTCMGNAATDPNCLAGQTYNVFSVNHNLRPSYNQNFNLNIQKSLGQAAVLEVGYVGGVARRLTVMQNINQNGAFNAEYPNFGSIIQLNSIGNSNYNSLQTTLRVRAYHGFTSQFSFTWAHALDDMTEYRGEIPQDSFNLAQEYGSSDYDTRLNFTAFLAYDIPGAHRWKLITSGWQANGFISIHSGQPFNFPGWDLSGAQRPGVDVIGNPYAGVSHNFVPGVGEEWVNPAAFVPLTSGPGNLGRNALYGPGFADVDLSVFKNFAIKERVHLQLRAEMFNVFNRINLASGPGSVGSNGYVSDTIGDFNGAPGLGPGEPFNLQIAAKVIF
jgi:Carboxypeptidase regulatory-like domain/TonB dependent receptor